MNDHANSDDMILRDYLALDRTVLANERTLLAYIRTFIGTLSAGLGMIHLVDHPLTTAVGFVMCVSSPLFLMIGAARFLRVHRKLKAFLPEQAVHEGPNQDI